ncbi:hypothetical protein FSP39_009970 [Pinctada imbricata]|uniref:ubiquitinyl hydrolase 1 n=1 Tax=Pinctada imbricata TaxID=66713 RepID=A0AA88YA42_PINIB|nr:hypothetical protein FSP39_009970 [Pinctada imbricata]
MDKQRLLKQFVERTGLEPEAAADLLAKSHWDYAKAFHLFEDCLKTGKIKPLYPHTGPTNSPSKVPPQTPPKPSTVPSGIQSGFGPANSELRDVYERVRHPGSGTQWMDPYGEVRRPVERVVPIQIEQQGYIPARPLSGHQPTKSSPVHIQSRPASEFISPKPVTENLGQISGQKLLPGRQCADTGTHNPSQTGKLNSMTHIVSKDLGPGPMNTKQSVFKEPYPVTKPQVTTQVKAPVSYTTSNMPAQISPGTTKAPVTTTTSLPVPTKTDNQSNNPPKSPASSPRPLKRGISKIVENEYLVTETRNNLLHDIEEDSHDHMYVQTFVLPDLTKFPADYRAFLEKDLIETSTLVSLEQAGRLNWWAEMGVCQRLLPMATTGDGNCLLHAASLAMWGIHDRELMLRRALYDTLTCTKYSKALHRRWKWQQTELNKEAGLILEEDEWKAEWTGILKLATTKPRTLPGMRRNSSCCDSPVTKAVEDTPVIYESLEEFHVFVLAHVLQRAIIVVADIMLKDSQGDALAPIPFGGIYLPLECESRCCFKTPLLLTYDAAHFSALVPMAREGTPQEEKPSLPDSIPLVGPDLSLLPVHFLVDPGPDYSWNDNKGSGNHKLKYSYEDKLNILKQYLDVEKLPATNMEYDSDSDKKSSGSYESDDNLGCIGKEKKKEGKVKDQLHSVTKQFGSLGKSMSKKLRKNFGSVGKALKSMGPDQKGSKSSIGSGLTQSTRVPLTIAAMSEQEQMFVWCARIQAKWSDVHKNMIQNYMKDARDRFLQDKEIRTARGEEIRRRSMEILPQDLGRIKCISPGCEMFGSPENHYMCSRCFMEQKRQAIDQEKVKSGTLPSKGKKPEGDGVLSFGKSKFYIESDGESDSTDTVQKNTSKVLEKPSVAKQQGKLLIDDRNEKRDMTPALRPKSENVPVLRENTCMSSNDRDARAKSQGQMNNVRARTPSPDYDNVDYGPYKRTAAPESPKFFPKAIPVSQSPKQHQKGPVIPVPEKGTQARACRTPGCAFYGSPEQNDFCSGCYKRSKQHYAHNPQLTRL